MTELGEMKALDGNTEISHIPDWYQWEREQVKAELEKGEYGLDIPVDILIMTDTKSVYEVGEGRLEHNENGFRISGCDGKLDYRQSATAIYSINADFFWYQIADTVNIGDHNVQYFCFPKDKSNSVAKVRLAAEELFKIAKKKLKE